MQTVSAAFAAAIKSRAFVARVVLDSGEDIQGDAILSVEFKMGSNADTGKMVIGSAVSASVDITLDRERTQAAFDGKSMQVFLGFPDSLPNEWLAMGTYNATAPIQDDGTMIVKGFDALGVAFETVYVPLEDFDFSQGVSAVAFLQALGARRGIPVSTDNLEDITLIGEPVEGVTERQLIGMVAGMYGGFAVVNRDGVLQVRRYTLADFTLTADDYYEGALEKTEYRYIVRWLSCYSPSNGQSHVCGDVTAAQGIYFECPWCTAESAAAIWNRISGFSYCPVKGITFLGDPRIDPWDIITVTDISGTVLSVPVMSIYHTFDGGLTTTIAAPGQAVTDGYEGPLARDVVQRVNQAVGGLTQQEIFDRLTNGGQDQGIYIHDGKIYLNVEYLSSKVFTSIVEVFLEPGQPEFETIKNHILNSSLIPDDNLHLYDFNGDGLVTITDALMCKEAALGLSSLAGWSGAVKTPVAVTLSAQDPNRAILITGENMWGRSVEIYFGINGTNANRAVGDFAVAGNMSIAGGAFEFSFLGEMPALSLSGGDPKKLSWKDNGDGTFSLIGT